MSSTGPKSLAGLLRSGALETLAEQARQHRELTSTVRAALPAEEAQHLVLAQLDAGGALVLTMDSAVWAARVRYRAELLGPRPLKVKVLPRELPADGPSSS